MIQELVESFAKNVVGQKIMMDQGNPKAGNRHARKYIEDFRSLRQLGPQGLDALAILLDDERSDVKVAAAAFLMRHCTSKAMPIIEASARQKSPLGFGSQITLDRWKNGTYTMDVE